MPNERIVYTHDRGPDKSFRILATGEFDAEMVAVLQAFAEFQAKVVPKIPTSAPQIQRLDARARSPIAAGFEVSPALDRADL